MGVAIRRPDGTYRSWHAAPQSGLVLGPGETLVDLEGPPEILPPRGPAPDLRAQAKAAPDLRTRALGRALIDLINTGRHDLTETDLDAAISRHIDRL